MSHLSTRDGSGGKGQGGSGTPSRSTFWRVGFCFHLAFVTVIGAAAYLRLLHGLTPSLAQNYDLVLHALFIGLLAFFLDGSLRFRPLLDGRLRWLRLGPVIVLTLAGVEELLQSLSPHRSCSALDFAADTVGVVLLSSFALRLERWWCSRGSNDGEAADRRRRRRNRGASSATHDSISA